METLESVELSMPGVLIRLAPGPEPIAAARALLDIYERGTKPDGG